MLAVLRQWTPREISFRAGRLLTRRLVDRGRFSDIDRLASAAGNDIGLVLAVTRELASVHRYPPAQAVARTLRLVRDRRVGLAHERGWDHEETSSRGSHMPCLRGTSSRGRQWRGARRAVESLPAAQSSTRFGVALRGFEISIASSICITSGAPRRDSRSTRYSLTQNFVNNLRSRTREVTNHRASRGSSGKLSVNYSPGISFGRRMLSAQSRRLLWRRE